MKQFARARQLIERGLAVFRLYFAEDHPQTQWALRQIEALTRLDPRNKSGSDGMTSRKGKSP
jgi:hypothetical protein